LHHPLHGYLEAWVSTVMAKGPRQVKTWISVTTTLRTALLDNHKGYQQGEDLLSLKT
jgi:hypothetical protein